MRFFWTSTERSRSSSLILTAVQVEHSTLRLLETLSEKVGGALAVVSGREIAVVDRLLRPLVLPVAGVHGLERRDARGIIHSRDTADISSINFRA